jgi:hypothetical protein
MSVRPLLALAFGAALLAAASVVRAQNPQNPCEQQFLPLRADMENKGKALQAAGKRKVTPKELCPLARSYFAAEAKVVKFIKDNQTNCQIPPQVVKQASETHAKTTEFRTKVCAAAENAVAPPPPSSGLSGAIGTTPQGGAPGTTPGGSGVFDTLTGNVLKQ